MNDCVVESFSFLTLCFCPSVNCVCINICSNLFIYLLFIHGLICLYAYPGPHGVSELRYRSSDSTALWVASTTHQPTVAFLYALSLKNGPTIKSSRVTDTELLLPGLVEGTSYVLDVWAECDGQWTSERSHVYFEGSNSSSELLVRAVGPAPDLGQSEVPLVQQGFCSGVVFLA